LDAAAVQEVCCDVVVSGLCEDECWFVAFDGVVGDEVVGGLVELDAVGVGEGGVGDVSVGGGDEQDAVGVVECEVVDGDVGAVCEDDF